MARRAAVRPALRLRARRIYAGAAVFSAFLAADSIDLVPPDETETRPVITDLGPVIEAGRIVRPEVGFAVTFPDDWTVREPTPAGAASLMAGSDPRADAQLLADSAERGEVCTGDAWSSSLRRRAVRPLTHRVARTG